MRLGEGQPITVGDVTLQTNLTWGAMKAINALLNQIPDGDVAAQLEFAEGVLLKHTISVTGLEDENGKAVVKLSAAVVDKLPPSFINQALDQLLKEGTGADTDVVDESGNP